MRGMHTQPGPELNAMVAKAISRSCLFHSWERTDECIPEGCIYRCRNCFEHVLSDGPPVMETCVPPYSTDANCAIEAAESMFRDFYVWHNDSGSCYHAYASFTRCIQEDCKFQAMGDTMPHAISLAILAAKGEV